MAQGNKVPEKKMKAAPKTARSEKPAEAMGVSAAEKAAKTGAGVALGARIHVCGCIHPGQDALYGRGNRLHNVCGPKSRSGQCRCTVCGTLRTK